MTITFQNFERVIDPAILERGWEYYRSGRVRGLEKDDEGNWFAYVSGTVKYEVQIEEAPDGELLCECTCPYEWGPHCKHIAAVLYAIKEQSGDEEAARPRRSKSPKQKHEEKLRAMLERLSQDELISLLMEQFEKDEAFASRVLNRYGDEAQSKSVYARRVREALKAGRGEYGYVDYWGATRAARAIQQMLAEADTLIGRGQPHKAVPMLQAIVEALVPALEEADDSSGELGGCIEEAFEYLHRAAEALPAPEKRALFTYCLSEAVGERYEGWDWSWEPLHVAAKLVITPQEREQLFRVLDRRAKRRAGKEFFGHYDSEQAARIKLVVIERQDGPEKAHEFLLQHSHLEGIRQELVAHYIKQGSLADAKRLCLEAIAHYGAGGAHLRHPYAITYHQFLLDIAQRERDSAEIIRLARQLFLSTGQFSYYDDILKKEVPAVEWPAFVEGLVQTIRKERVDWDAEVYFLPEIFAREAMWDRILALVKERGTSVLERYRQQMEEWYPDEVCTIYDKSVHSILERASGRKDYQKACGYLMRMKQLGKQERVQEIIRQLQAKYPKRRALMEELDRV